MKIEVSNLNTLASTFLQVDKYEPLQLTFPYACACFRHAMNKECQYAIPYDKVCVGMRKCN